MKKMCYVLIAAIFVLPFTVSASNLLSNLEVEGIPTLSMTKSTYNLTLTTTLNYANIIATPAKEGVTVTGAGKIEVQEGTNALIVTATDGTTTETYTINLNIKHGDPNAEATDGNPNTGSFLPVSLLLLSLVAIAIAILNKRRIFNI